MHTVWYGLFYGTHFEYGTDFFIRSEFCERQSFKETKETANWIHITDIYSLKHLQAFLEALFMSSSWALSLCSINRCCSYIRSRCPFQSAQICSKFLLLSFKIPSILTRFLWRAEPPRETCWSWLPNEYLQIIYKGKNIKKGQTLVSSQPVSQPASQHSQPLGRSVGQIMAVTR